MSPKRRRVCENVGPAVTSLDLPRYLPSSTSLILCESKFQPRQCFRYPQLHIGWVQPLATLGVRGLIEVDDDHVPVLLVQRMECLVRMSSSAAWEHRMVVVPPYYMMVCCQNCNICPKEQTFDLLLLLRRCGVRWAPYRQCFAWGTGCTYFDLLVHIWHLIDSTAVIQYGQFFPMEGEPAEGSFALINS